jgi:hypothetical protein
VLKRSDLPEKLETSTELTAIMHTSVIAAYLNGGDASSQLFHGHNHAPSTVSATV